MIRGLQQFEIANECKSRRKHIFAYQHKIPLKMLKLTKHSARHVFELVTSFVR